jgi:cytochrome b561
MSVSERYSRTAIALHWLIAILVVVQFAWGWWMQEIPKQPVGPRAEAFNLHKSVGLMILALMIIRILWRLSHRPPPLVGVPRWQTRAARANHALLYLALVIQPLAGYLGSEFSGFPVRFFGLILPSWAGKNVPMKELMSTVHLVTSWAIAAAIVAHVVAALKHAVIDRDGLLARMGIGTAPRRAPEPPSAASAS